MASCAPGTGRGIASIAVPPVRVAGTHGRDGTCCTCRPSTLASWRTWSSSRLHWMESGWRCSWTTTVRWCPRHMPHACVCMRGQVLSMHALEMDALPTCRACTHECFATAGSGLRTAADTLAHALQDHTHTLLLMVTSLPLLLYVCLMPPCACMHALCRHPHAHRAQPRRCCDE